MHIAIQGQQGSFHDLASRNIWTDQILNFKYCDTFKEVFEAVKNNQVDLGLTAIENSLYGSIHQVYDLLLENDFWISGETTLAIRQNLIAWEGAQLDDITEVYSHPVALDQCRYWLSQHLPNAELIEFDDTAGSVTLIQQKQLKNAAAIGPELAAINHKMPILARNIEDDSNNFTRFIVLSKTKQFSEQASRASINLTAHHRPGALYGALGILTELGLNLTKLESRPIRGQKFLYQFIIDFEATHDQLNQAINGLKNYGCDVTLLGHYVTYK